MQPESPLGQPTNNPEPPRPEQTFSPTQPPAYPGQPVAPQVPHPPAYDFIINPERPGIKQPRLGNRSLPIKIALVTGGLLVLVIILSLLRGLLGGGSNFEPYITVVQDQQALIHIVTNAKEQKELSANNENFVATSELSLISARSKIMNYLKSNNQKVDPKQLGLKISASTDSELQAAAAATTYNKTFEEVMNSKLSSYKSDLQQTYNQAKGEKGRAILSDLFDEAELLQKQLQTP